MNILQLLKGKQVMVKADVGVMVKMEIKEVKENNHSEELEPSTQANDWWPATRDWKTYTVTFSNGYTKEYNSINDIDLI